VAVACLIGQPTVGEAAATQVHAAADLPDGRANYVISMMDGKPNALAVRLAIYSFAGNGTVTERYWAWRQDWVSGKGNVSWTKPASGYTTSGCRHNCPVRTPFGFQRGAKPKVFTGTWSMESDSVLAIRWTPRAAAERWQLDDGQPGIVGARLLSAGYGWGVGSNAGINDGVPLAQIHSEGGWVTGPFMENAYASATKSTTTGFNPVDYDLCAGRHCLQSKTVTAADKKSWYSSYLAGDPAADGRKVFYNNQTGAVQQMENPGSVCISASGGGHTNALLQALDDDGRFVGFVGVEASLNQRKYGQDIVAAYALLQPGLLSAIGR
jgi:hypothetical protein